MTVENRKPSDLGEHLGRCIEMLQRWELDARRGDIRSDAKPYYANGMFAGDLRDMAELMGEARGKVGDQMIEPADEPVRIVTPFAHMVAMAVRRPEMPKDQNQRVLVYGDGVNSEHGHFDIVRTVDLLTRDGALKAVTHWIALNKPSNDGDAGIPMGSDWKHTGGDVYTVSGHTNLHSTQPERYPPSIVYVGPDGHVWSRPVADWSRSMTLQGVAK